LSYEGGTVPEEERGDFNTSRLGGSYIPNRENDAFSTKEKKGASEEDDRCW